MAKSGWECASSSPFPQRSEEKGGVSSWEEKQTHHTCPLAFPRNAILVKTFKAFVSSVINCVSSNFTRTCVSFRKHFSPAMCKFLIHLPTYWFVICQNQPFSVLTHSSFSESCQPCSQLQVAFCDTLYWPCIKPMSCQVSTSMQWLSYL